MRNATFTLTLIALLAATLLPGCVGGGTKTPQPTPSATSAATRSPSSPGPATPASSAASPTVAASPSAPAPTGESVEVTGIVGSVSAGTRVIQIERRSGAAVTKVNVGPATVIRRAAGGTTSLAQIKPSDRIIARGTLSERGDALVAVEITIQEVVPGSSPGG